MGWLTSLDSNKDCLRNGRDQGEVFSTYELNLGTERGDATLSGRRPLIVSPLAIHGLEAPDLNRGGRFERSEFGPQVVDSSINQRLLCGRLRLKRAQCGWIS
jgi:hypothetical protein